MCGITGIISAGSQHDSNLICRMTNLLVHRGPDDEGYLAVTRDNEICPLTGKDSKVAGDSVLAWQRPAWLYLGHRRLSIIETSPAGHQPMASHDRSHWIVYNGEIYNYPELREELRSLGYPFRTHGDTEVILAAYETWGVDCLKRLNGMFAFILYDRAEQRLVIARDRFGVKPLYYWAAPSGILAIASEIKAFTVLPGWNARMNGQRIYDFLVWGVQDHTDETMFADVYQIPPGNYSVVKLDLTVSAGMKVSGGRLTCVPWWELTAQDFSGTMDNAVQEFGSLLTDAVRLRLRADVPVGSCLSGGLDSSTLVCITNRLLRDQEAHGLQKTFSACSEIKRFDEREFMDEVVRHTDVDPHYVYPALDGLFEETDAVTWHQDEPYGSTSIYAQWKVFGLAAANDVKVMLDGQGADELLAGYHLFFEPYLTGLFRRGEWPELLRDMRLLKKNHGYTSWSATKMIMGMLLPQATRNAVKRIRGKNHTSPGWLDRELLHAEPRDPFHELGYRTDSVQALSRAQFAGGTLPMLLHWEDRNSMAHSIESRLPFLDYRLVQFALGLPDRFKISAGVTKQVLRQSMKEVLPEKIRMRMDKLGFVTPEDVWVKSTDPHRFRSKVVDAVAASEGVLNGEAVALADRIMCGEQQFNHLIWRMVSFADWIRIFGVRPV
jgi:asparagine synthase (glutamine-hydrolysing)